ncbi:hypothetical protein [Paenibacillus bouchesdurhonensis]|uniref:hypothetical protein n=1 Tax=Paenibacillus bouchesdurhonensis TaxID=1870990 RepID=UPI001F2A35AC|nr:hypothetical protein [Paenibacillus bouchesdurhonensis]
MLLFPSKINLALMLSLVLLLASLLRPAMGLAHPQTGLEASFALLATTTDAAAAPQDAIQFANKLIYKLAEDKPFTNWKGASPEFQPLGPGMHAWLVTLYQKKTPVGYLIIGAHPSGGYALIEYGAGSEPLFDTAALKRALAAEHSSSDRSSLQSLRIEQLYAGPLLAEWRIIASVNRATGAQAAGDALHMQYRDARNADPLPDNESIWQKLLSVPTQLSAAIVASGQSLTAPAPPTMTSDSFDPSDNLLWLTSEKLKLTASSFTKELHQHKSLIFAARGEDRNYTLPLPVYGYQSWEQAGDTNAECLYIMTGSANSPRFIAFDELAKAGQFYTSTTP